MRRRKFITLLGGAAAAWPIPQALKAQQRVKRWVVGMLDIAPEATNFANVNAFRQQLQKLGYFEGQNLVIEYRFPIGSINEFQKLAEDLERLQVNVIVTRTTPAVLAARNTSPQIPIVMTGSGDPVKLGIVSSLSRPGGRITGLTTFLIDLAAKRLELFKELIPQITRVAFLDNMGNPVVPPLWDEFRSTAQLLGLEAQLLDVRKPEELEQAFRAARSENANGIFVGNEAMFTGNRQRVIALAAEHRLPALYHDRAWVDAGGLISYGVDQTDLYGRAAIYVDKIFKGATPADLPIEQPTKLNLVINLKTAKTLGVSTSTALLARADEVIE